jgi:hypothetical protein
VKKRRTARKIVLSVREKEERNLSLLSSSLSTAKSLRKRDLLKKKLAIFRRY